ncbi:MAG TPA: glycosyltransferase family 9 protein, partial [Gemmataceae bacterium]|nr:glycosyltransferase family 9 protein [Gemmataceae bacterium]
MPRPCAGAHAPSPQSCHLCKLVATRPDYAALWGEWSPSFAAGGCRHRGAELPGGAPLKTWACALHGRCHLTAGARLDGVTDCSRCPDRPRAVVCTADGIGDAVLGLLAAAGVARAHPAREVAYRVKPHQLPWVRLFGGYDRADATAGFGRDDPDAFYPHLTYGEQNAERLSRPRWEHYAAACGADAALPPVRPLPDAALRRAAGYRGAVVLCPRSQHGMRTWHLSHWLRLEAHLRGRGMRTVAIDSLPEPIAEFAGEKFVGLAPQEVAALMLASWCVVANDSGMAHVAGALGVPVVVVSGVIRGERLYGFYRHPRCVDGPLGCTGCHWHGPDYRRACDSVCASLQAVEPGEAAAAVDRAATSADFLDRVASAARGSPRWSSAKARRQRYVT